MTRTRPVPTLLLVLAATAAGGEAQVTPADSTVVLRGRVVDGPSRRPLPDAVLSVEGVHASFVTGADGVFQIRVPATPPWTLHVGRLGYVQMDFEVDRELLDRALVLPLRPQPFELEGVGITVDRIEEVERALDLRTRAYGESSRSLEADEIGRSSAANALELVIDRGNGMLFPCFEPAGELCARARPRASLRETGPGVATQTVLVCVDEARAWGALSHLRAVPAREVYRLEFYGVNGRDQVRVYTRWFMAEKSREGGAALLAVQMGC